MPGSPALLELTIRASARSERSSEPERSELKRWDQVVGTKEVGDGE